MGHRGVSKERNQAMNIELDLLEKVFFAVACPVFASALVVTFYMMQHKWEKRMGQRWWKERQAEWIEGYEQVGGAK